MKYANFLFITLLAFLFTSCLDSTGPEDDYDNTADLEFLEENAEKEGVTVTDSGLQYSVVEEADGPSPTPESAVVFHYIGRLIDDTVFVNSYDQDRTSNILVDNLLPGLREGVQLMNTGAIYEFVLPADLAFGDNPPQGIPAGATIIFEFELVHDNSLDPLFLSENAEQEDVEVTESGLQYRILEEGDGEKPTQFSDVTLEYTGTFIFGDEFDTSRDSEAPASLNVNGVIDGFAEGLRLMNEGARYEFFIPADLAYGNEPPQQSPIYPGATLIFDVELISVDD